MAARKYPPVADRLMQRVEYDTNGLGCWFWTGAVSTSGGYGIISVNDQLEMAHRCSWELSNGTVPDGLQVLHTCDIPVCINPAHLFLGTHDDNMKDMARKGRTGGPIGYLKRLAPEQRSAIMSDYIRGHKEFGAGALARKYGVTPSAIRWTVKAAKAALDG